MPRYSKRHYQDIAEILGRVNREGLTMDRILHAFLTTFTADNPTFAIDRFLKAVDQAYGASKPAETRARGRSAAETLTEEV